MFVLVVPFVLLSHLFLKCDPNTKSSNTTLVHFFITILQDSIPLLPFIFTTNKLVTKVITFVWNLGDGIFFEGHLHCSSVRKDVKQEIAVFALLESDQVICSNSTLSPNIFLRQVKGLLTNPLFLSGLSYLIYSVCPEFRLLSFHLFYVFSLSSSPHIEIIFI